MVEEAKQLVKKDTEHLIGQVAAFAVLRPLVITIVGLVCIHNGHALMGAALFLLGVISLINGLKWNGRAMEIFRRGRPLAMKVYFSKRNSLTPFMDLKASLDDQRGFDPIRHYFQPHWELLGANWDANKVLGEARDCLVYIDRETGQVFAFRLDDGMLFVKPYFVVPWRKVDVRALINSGRATEAELAP